MEHPFYAAPESSEYYFEERCHILEVMNAPEAPSVSIARARVEPGTTTVLHSVDRTEVYYILEGIGEATVGEQKRTMSAGEAVYIAPGTPQRITNIGQGDLLFLAICTPRFLPQSYADLEGK